MHRLLAPSVFLLLVLVPLTTVSADEASPVDDIATAELRQLTKEPGYWTSPVVSPDGKSIAYVGYPFADKTYQMPRLHVMDIDGSSPRRVSDSFDRPPGSLIWDADGSGF